MSMEQQQSMQSSGFEIVSALMNVSRVEDLSVVTATDVVRRDQSVIALRPLHAIGNVKEDEMAFALAEAAKAELAYGGMELQQITNVQQQQQQQDIQLKQLEQQLNERDQQLQQQVDVKLQNVAQQQDGKLLEIMRQFTRQQDEKMRQFTQQQDEKMQDFTRQQDEKMRKFMVQQDEKMQDFARQLLDEKMRQFMQQAEVIRENQVARSYNVFAIDADHTLEPLLVESVQAQHALGTAPSAVPVNFPATVDAMSKLTNHDLDQLQDFYNTKFSGKSIKTRRCRFAVYIGATGVIRQAG
ncbi:hypothetical protein VaNZ11_000023, partial [Volvox africanus]